GWLTLNWSSTAAPASRGAIPGAVLRPARPASLLRRLLILPRLWPLWSPALALVWPAQWCQDQILRPLLLPPQPCYLSTWRPPPPPLSDEGLLQLTANCSG